MGDEPAARGGGFLGIGPRPRRVREPLAFARRTVDLSLRWPRSRPGRLVVVGRATDEIRTGDAVRSVTASVEAVLGAGGRLESLSSEPPLVGLDQLIDLSVGRGFRVAAEAAVAPESDRLVRQLLDELPIAQVLSGYRAVASRGEGEGPDPEVTRAAAEMLTDVCAGWQHGSEALSLIASGVPAIAASPPPDPDVEAALEPDSIRRRRTIDVGPTGGGHHVDAWFRDSYRAETGPTVVLHEYDLEVETADGLIERCSAVPRVLPFGECPAAAANVGRLVGTAVADVRGSVRSHLGRVDGCTHLNDLIRSLVALDQLVPPTS